METFLSFLPPWLSALLTHKFYDACIIHEGSNRNAKNFFCKCCCEAICNSCKPLHRTHSIIQIRRHIYCDVVRVEDIEKFMDCSSIQPYLVNSAKAVHLKQREGSSDLACSLCNRVRLVWPDEYRHCSIYCKVKETIETGKKLSDFVHNWEDIVLVPMEESINSNSSTVREGMSCMSLGCTATTSTNAVVIRKKRTTVYRSRPASLTVAGKSYRRKGTPRRSHLA